jgi:hypothetical protein
MIQQIINDNIGELLNMHLPVNKINALFNIAECRTAHLGGHVDLCPNCNGFKISYNSCRNRHCPKCQNIAKEEWIESRMRELINTPYFHVVFTVPDSLNSIFYNNQKELYSLLFYASSQTLMELAQDKKYLGAEIGVTSVLHTWGQTIVYHPHVHCIVPGGGLTESGLGFIKSKSKFFIPVKVISSKFRGKFINLLEKLVDEKKVILPSNLNFKKFKKILSSKEWVVFCKKTFKKPEHVIKYLGRYTHKIAITNSRIIKYKNNKVTFKYKDNKDKNKAIKVMTLKSIDFIKRFLLHILPKKFVKIRHYGILSNRNKKTKLKKCQILTRVNVSEKLSKRNLLEKIFGYDVLACPICGFKTVNRYFFEAKFDAG